jgi:hypothetical protein
LANTHLLALILAGSLHLYFLLLNREDGARQSALLSHALVGLVVLLPTLYFIFPPSDSALDFNAFLSRIHIKQQLTVMLLAPFRSFIPVPAWWEYHFWNTQFLLEAQQRIRLLKGLTLLLSLALPLLAVYILKGNRKSLVVFGANLFVTLIMSIVFPLMSVRYTGFIFIGFMVAYWLYTTETAPGRKAQYLVNILLVIQLAGSIVAVTRDIRYPFSNAYYTNEVLKKVPPGKRIVTDFWCADMLSAYTGKAFYCVELERDFAFLQWKTEYRRIFTSPGYYYRGMKKLFEREHVKEVYFVTTRSGADLQQVDGTFMRSFQVNLVDKRDQAIEKSSNLFLYLVRKRQDQ